MSCIECIPCLARQMAEAVALTVRDPDCCRASVLRILLRELSESDWQTPPPVIAGHMHRMLRNLSGCPDPYLDIKRAMNRTAIDVCPIFQEQASRHTDPREAVVRLAICGNLLDSGAKTQIMAEELPTHLNANWTTPLNGDVAALFNAAEMANSILYLADNAGEIIFDRMLIEALPSEKITVFVRGGPVINDATLEDAVAAQLPEIAPVLENGSDSPGTVLEDCSEAFRDWFEHADLVISKGQGNYECLSDTTKHTFFLFTVKCSVVASHVGYPVGSQVIKEVGGHPREGAR